jgi:phospholipid/cholesterol/gamma-HCH transport system substrate-binding protein
VLAKISALADRLSDLVNDKNRAALADTLTNLKTTTGVLAKHSADFDKTLDNLAVASQDLHTDLLAAHELFGHADMTTQKLDKLADDADSTITGARLDALVGQTRVLVASLGRLSDQLQSEPTRLIFGDRRKGYTPQ